MGSARGGDDESHGRARAGRDTAGSRGVRTGEARARHYMTALSQAIYCGVARRPSLSLRLSRALVGLVTVWCLGCSSYEPILTSLLGGRAVGMMTCDGETGAASNLGVAAATSAPLENSPAVSAPAENRGFDCGCGRSCHASAPNLPAAAQRPAPVPGADQFAPTAPAAITRTPLLPPPEFVA